MNVLLISPYHGGSHRAWAEGIQTYSRHEISLLSLPDRFWKWRMHGGAVTLARRYLAEKLAPEAILATDMLDLTTFLALTRPYTSSIPVAFYMHENQLTYPLPALAGTGPMRRQGGERDNHYVFINYASMAAADQILFNSEFHLESWFTALPKFLKHFPEYQELGSVSHLRAKSRVLPVGINFDRLQPQRKKERQVPLIIWNQRWEYDKNPESFFRALNIVAEAGYHFEVALCGRQYGRQPPAFADGGERLKERIIHSGYAEDDRYHQLLWQADIVLSTAHHEFFGISILEAIYCYTFPILPRRLSYPELLPEEYHGQCLYENEAGLIDLLMRALDNLEAIRRQSKMIAAELERYNWRSLITAYDAIF